MRLSMRQGWLDLDDTYSPIFVATWMGELEVDVFKQYLQQTTSFLIESDMPLVLVLDGTRCSSVDSMHRKLQADWIRFHAEHIKRHKIAVSFAFSAMMQRGIMTAVHWLSPPPYAFNVSPTRKGAIDWACEYAQSIGLVLPANITDAYATPTTVVF